MKSVLLAAAAVIGLAGAAIAAAPVENSNSGTGNSAATSGSGATAPGNDAAAPHASSRDTSPSATGGANQSDSARLTNCGMNGSAQSGTTTATGDKTSMNCEPAQSGSSTPGASSSSGPSTSPSQGSAPASNR